MQTKKYIGPRGVDSVVIEEMKTYSGAEVVTVHYDGGYKELMTKKTFELVASEEPSDYTAVRNKKFDAMSVEFYKLLGDYFLAISTDPTNKKDARHSFLEKAMSMINEYDIKVAEIEPFLNAFIAESTSAVNAVGYEIDNAFNRATNYLWTKDDAQFVPGTNMMMERTLLESKRITSEIPAPTPAAEVKAEEAKPEDNGAEAAAE